MKKIASTGREEPPMAPKNVVAALAIVTEMARRLNENISKVKLKPFDRSLISEASSGAQAEISKA